MTPGVNQLRAQRVAQALGALFTGTKLPIIVLDAQGRFVSANEVACRAYGYTLDELFAMRVHDLQASPRPVDDDLARVLRGDDVLLDRRPHRCKDGSILWVVPSPSVIAIDGEPHIVSTLTDVTATVGAEERARIDELRAELVWQAAVERLGCGFGLLDRDRRVLRINKTMCALLRRDAREVVGKPCWEVFPMCAGEDPCIHQLALQEQRRIATEIVSARTGKPLKVEVLPALECGTNVATIHMVTDLTEERAIRSQLVTTDRLATIGRLAAGVAHEVNNPAGFVTLALQLLKDQIAQGRAQTEEMMTLLDEAVGAMLQINQIMRDLTGFTRERARATIDLCSVANSAIRIASHETRERARVTRSFEDGVFAEVRGARVAQVILNLIVNAAQAITPGSPDRNEIEVRVYNDADSACIEVLDTGPGVPPELGDRIFEPFFTTRESTGGTGLGLWLSRTIIEDEGGTLTFHNRSGGGACFVILLPVPGAEVRDRGRRDDTPQAGGPELAAAGVGPSRTPLAGIVSAARGAGVLREAVGGR